MKIAQSSPLSTDSIVCLDNDKRQVVSKLDYVYRHYRFAVFEKNLKVKSVDKYKIVERVLNNALDSAKKCLSNPVDSQLSYIEQVQSDFKNVVEPSQLEKNIETVRDDLIKKFALETAPNTVPDMIKGQKVYKTICAQCHGDKGDANTAAAHTFKVKPTAFSDANIIDRLSPYQLYNTVTDGVEATNMPNFKGISEEERWAVVNYIMFLASKASSGGTVKKSVYVPWEKTMNYTNGELKKLIERLGVLPSEQNTSVSHIRSLSLYTNQSLIPPLNKLYQTELLFVKTQLLIAEKNQREARKIALTAYFDYFKKIEPWLIREGYSKEVTDFETLMFNFTSSFSKTELNQNNLLNEVIATIQNLTKKLIDKI